MNKEGLHTLTFEEHKKALANKTVFELSVLRTSLINDFVKDKSKGYNPLGQYIADPLEGARENLRFTTENVLPIFRDYFKLAGRGFDLGHPSVSFFGATAISFDPDMDTLVYAFAPGRKPAVLSDDILNRLYNAGINPVAVETFGRLSRIQIIDEVILAIKHPILKNVKDSLQRATRVV
jgi:hypothetical protein